MAAFVIRAPQFGNPVIQIDEQFYLLVGDRMLHGTLPYVDIWDRKPIGLFAIFAACRLLGGDGIMQYQIVATLFVGLTAYGVARLANRIASESAAALAGLVYIAFLSANGGDGGQAPVFYNLLVVASAASVARSFDARAAAKRGFGHGCAAMILMGIAIQVKYSVIFEGAFFGLAMIVDVRRHGQRVATILGSASVWILLAVVPTIGVAAFYAYLGHEQAFLFANFESVFQRPSVMGDELRARLLRILWQTAPIVSVAGAGCLHLVRNTPQAHRNVGRFFAGWAVVAVFALLVFGTYHDHYALPILAPCALAGSVVYDRRLILRSRMRPTGLYLGVAVLVAGLLIAANTIVRNRHNRGDGSAARAIAAYVKPRLTGCVFVFSGDPILYHFTDSCLPTAYAFTTFLSESREASSLGVDQVTELKRVMDAKPSLVISRSPASFPEASPAAWAYIEPILQRDYRVAMTRQVGNKVQVVYQRRAVANPH